MTYVCDWCGEELEDQRRRGHVRVSASGSYENGGRVSKQWHFHAGEKDGDSCLQEALRAIELRDRSNWASPSLRAQHARAWADYEDLCSAWSAMDWEVREHLVLEALGEDELTISEIARRLNRQLGWTAPPVVKWPPISTERARAVAMRLLKSGQLQRVPSPHGTGTIWKFSRRSRLDGAIADLERAFNDDAAG
jgi:hypothetical protein